MLQNRIGILIVLGFCLGANSPGRNPALATLPWIPSDLALPKSQQMELQGTYPFCSLYAMTTFLELYANSQQKSKRIVSSLDPSFLAASYNYEIGNLYGGVDILWVAAVTKLHGIIPKGSQRYRPTNNSKWPIPQWEQRLYTELAPTPPLFSLISGEFLHKDIPQPFTASQFLSEEIGIDFRVFHLMGPSPWTKPEEKYEDKIFYRIEGENYPKVKQRIGGLAESFGMTAVAEKLDGEKTREALQRQIESGIPVILVIDHNTVRMPLAGKTTDWPFANYTLLTESHLDGSTSANPMIHAVVAVGICDDGERTEKICAPFKKQLREERIGRCTVLQNSWGDQVHWQGYSCVSDKALDRLIRAAYLMKKFVE